MLQLCLFSYVPFNSDSTLYVQILKFFEALLRSYSALNHLYLAIQFTLVLWNLKYPSSTTSTPANSNQPKWFAKLQIAFLVISLIPSITLSVLADLLTYRPVYQFLGSSSASRQAVVLELFRAFEILESVGALC
eukprot:TRINITY_DN13153_c0_g1_i1.p2 TRINITY_DN13153_c0_g1~~TRINITY_DN13153_c0_g1_i1.p2  ORF type:complete len:134 (+),score=25.51 TRINITY_DN13153_c0_g1_i1:288-689(+)